MSNNWYCYMIFNKKLLNDPLIKTWIMNIFVILIASIFSVLLAIFFSKKNYMPIYALKEHLYDKESAVQAGNDYDLIRSRITEIINSADTAKRKITD